VTRRLFYKPDQDRYDIFVGVKISNGMNQEIECAWAASDGRRKTDFIRMMIAEGLKAWRERQGPRLRSPGGT
jgi:hypothetical protein